MSKIINTIPIQQFVNQVKAAELSNQREIKLDIKTAKSLVYCLAELSSKLVADYDKLLADLKASVGGETTVAMDGGPL